MDQLYQRSRRHDQSGNDSRHSFRDNAQQNRSLFNSSERPRSGLMTAAQITPRSIGSIGGYTNYMPEQSPAFVGGNLPTSPLSYGSDYGQDARQQTGSFSGSTGYNAGNMMYNVPQAGNQSSVYDTQSYGQRQSALQLMGPDVTSSYFTSDAAGQSGTNMAQTTPSGGFEPHASPLSYQDSLAGVQALQPGTAGIETMGTDHDYNEGELEEKWHSYQRQLGSVFQEISNGSLESASRTLLNISSWLLSQVVDLGLTQDDASLHGDRIKLWNDFNHAWLALGHRQREMMASGEVPSRNQTLLTEDGLIRMGDELVRLCDGIERHGLVDYQYGVWEDQIESILEDCIDQFDSVDTNSR